MPELAGLFCPGQKITGGGGMKANKAEVITPAQTYEEKMVAQGYKLVPYKLPGGYVVARWVKKGGVL